ncbi:MAG TPA: hypothetical protein DCE41_12415, partial [Cytophagales bacterium]|nr:hypothetical protein [Cytophagales bacterium]
DVRRGLLTQNRLDLKASEVMNADPITFPEGMSFRELLEALPTELARRQRKSAKFLSKIIFVNPEGVPTLVLDYHQLWEQRVATHRHVVVVGLGYVGLTLALVLADVGYLVTGVDVDENRVSDLNAGRSYVHEVGLPELLREHLGKNFHATTTLPDDGDVFVISVGTPVVRPESGLIPQPSMTALESSASAIGEKLRVGNLVVLRSTVPIGTSRDFMVNRLEEISKLQCGSDFHLAFAPERTAEGKAIQELRSLPQIIGGFNEDSMESTAALFREMTPTIVRVGSLEAAEMAKLINNTFRDLIFGYANYVSQIASAYNLDIHEVIRAANQGYVRDPVPLPSPGVGGPCLTKDPYIFAHVAQQHLPGTTLFEVGRTANEGMHDQVKDRLVAQLEAVGKDPRHAKVLVCGLAFKGHPETGDIRNSTALDIIDLVRPEVGTILGYDAVATTEELAEFGVEAVNSLPEGFADMDAVLFLNNHRNFTRLDVFEMVRAMNDSPIIFDGWNLFHEQDILKAAPAVYMGLSHVVSSLPTS